MKSLFLIGLLSVCVATGKAQEISYTPKEKVFNIGATLGFNAASPIINSLTVSGTEADDIHVRYKVGTSASLFFRANMDRFFIQPGFVWSRYEGDFRFSLPETLFAGQDMLATNESLLNAELSMKKESLSVPVLVGYHIVREGPYGLSFLVGPTFKYNYKVSYESTARENRQEFISESNPFGVNIGAGIAVRIWQLFFDFSYEFGLSHTESDFKSKNSPLTVADYDVQVDMRTNMLSFSIGFMF
ncbi:PorT family protein [Parabacteroides sp. OttesenSCG-928-G06]|nr:PorT family protein [Parabacteroides sp. OttesenSCG-928-K15]MDL2281534.1 PorT family protein [Parabacteroides sp. OttesenSCG-928-G06]